MSGTIDAVADAGGLPPPLLLSTSDASQLVYMLRQERAETILQLIATRNGEGVSTLARDISLVAAGSLGLTTLLLAAEPAGRRGGDWPRSTYGMPTGLRPLLDSPAPLEMLRVAASQLVVAAPRPGPTLQPASWTALLRDLRSQFELVVIDAPSLQRAFTGIMLAPHVDASVIVIAAESTRAAAARTLRDRLAEVGGVTAGAILNKRRFHVPRAAYERL